MHNLCFIYFFLLSAENLFIFIEKIDEKIQLNQAFKETPINNKIFKF